MKLENAIKKPNKKSLAACPIMLCILLTDDDILLYFGKTNQSYNIFLKDTQGHNHGYFSFSPRRSEKCQHIQLNFDNSSLSSSRATNNHLWMAAATSPHACSTLGGSMLRVLGRVLASTIIFLMPMARSPRTCRSYWATTSSTRG